MLELDILEELNNALLVDRLQEKRHQLLEKQSQQDLQDMCQALLELFLNDEAYDVRTLIYDEV
jgi:hypothetical protein